MAAKAKRFLNRELSWLEFDRRVLDEAMDNSVPLLDRLSFLAITASNLDEFFMVRIGGMEMLVANGVSRKDPSGMTPYQQRKAMIDTSGDLMDTQYRCLCELLSLLSDNGIRRLLPEQLIEEQAAFAEKWFEEEVFPVITPMMPDEGRYTSLIQPLRLHVCVRMGPPEGREDDVYAYLPVLGEIKRFIYLPGEGTPYIMIEDLLEMFLGRFFPGKEVRETAVFRVTRNADMSVKDELSTDFVAEMEEAVRQRTEGHCVRLELDRPVSRTMKMHLRKSFAVNKDAVFVHDGPVDIAGFFGLAGIKGYDGLKNEKWTPQQHPDLDARPDIFTEIKKGDLLLAVPFESFSPVAEFISQAADDPSVLAIKQILYRTSAGSPIIASLRRAAENGKNVTVLVELKARFDEAQNIEWARELERSGVQVIYGIKGLKTHAKICIVVRREPGGIVKYMHFGTGNYNEKTARLYTDIGLMTCDDDLGLDASSFFNMITGYSEPQRFRKLIAAPSGMKDRLIELINAEAERSSGGQKAWIKAKMNSLADPDVIEALYSASRAGVSVDLNVRGICCLKPGVKKMSENITVRSIVDRFLEHSRIFAFCAGGREDLFISSADWMPRNLVRRVELMVPVQDRECRRKLMRILKTCLSDNVKGAILQSDGSYKRIELSGRRKRVRSQQALCEEALARAKAHRAERKNVFEPHRAD